MQPKGNNAIKLTCFRKTTPNSKYNIRFRFSNTRLIHTFSFKVHRAFVDLSNDLTAVVNLCPVPYERQNAHKKEYLEHYAGVVQLELFSIYLA